MTRFSGQVCLAIFSSLAVAAAAQALNERVTYTIKVVDISGGPVVGAEVAALEVSYDYADGQKRMELIEQKKTGADGTTVLNLDFSRHTGAFIVARKESLAFTWDRLDNNALPIDGSQLTMLLDKPCVLAGTVVDQLGRPVAGARVRGEFDSSYLQNKHRINAPEDWFTVETDDHGRFCFDNVPPDGTADFLVTAPGKADIYTFMASDNMPGIRYAAGRTDIRIVLPDEAKIQGRVVDPAGKPVAGVRLLARPDKGVADYYCTNRAVSGEDGRFLFEHVPADTYSLQVVAPQDTMAEWVGKDIRVVAAVEIKDLTRPMNIVLKPALTLAGRITDPNGLPIPVARIQFCARPIPGWVAYIGEEIIPDKTGRYEMPAVPLLGKGDVYQVHVQAAGYCGLWGERISLTEISANRVDLNPFVMQPLNMSVSGVVVDADGKPIPNKSVALWGLQGGQGHPGKATITDNDGRFFFNRISKGPLRLQAGEARDKDVGLLEAQAGDKDVKIVMGRKGL